MPLDAKARVKAHAILPARRTPERFCMEQMGARPPFPLAEGMPSALLAYAQE